MTKKVAKQKLGPRQKKWIDALESGKYQQIQGVLNKNDQSFCCLGIACELSMDDIDLVKSYNSNKCVYYNYNNTTLPDEVMEYYGFRDHEGAHKNPDAKNLSNWNDSGKTFKQIAAQVKRYPHLYFTKAL